MDLLKNKTLGSICFLRSFGRGDITQTFYYFKKCYIVPPFAISKILKIAFGAILVQF